MNPACTQCEVRYAEGRHQPVLHVVRGNAGSAVRLSQQLSNHTYIPAVKEGPQRASGCWERPPGYPGGLTTATKAVGLPPHCPVRGCQRPAFRCQRLDMLKREKPLLGKSIHPSGPLHLSPQQWQTSQTYAPQSDPNQMIIHKKAVQAELKAKIKRHLGLYFPRVGLWGTDPFRTLRSNTKGRGAPTLY